MEKMDEDQARDFEEQIGMRFNPDREAQQALTAYQEGAGIVFEDPDAPVAPYAKSGAMAEDEELSGVAYMNQPTRNRGQRG